MSYAEDYAFELGTTANDRDQRLRWLSTQRRGIELRAAILVPPGYERRIHHYSVLARALADNGYRVIRFDLSNHVGLSDGEVADLSMTSIAGDVGSMLRSEPLAHSGLPVIAVAPSLAGRASARALATAAPPAGCVLLLPVVDVQYTIAQAAGIDGIEMWRRGEATDPDLLYRVVDHEVKYAFAQDAVERAWGGVEAARREIADIRAPVHAISAEHDDWVRAVDVEHALAGDSEYQRRLTILAATSHDVAHNPPVMRQLMTTTLEAIAAMLERDAGPVVIPDFEEVVETVTVERRWANTGYAEVNRWQAPVSASRRAA
jgi:alpha-beta hydrolase superfamily lysophospholipase